jgi:hypothetical protein
MTIKVNVGHRLQADRCGAEAARSGAVKRGAWCQADDSMPKPASRAAAFSFGLSLSGYGISRRFDARTKLETISLIGSMLVPLANLKGSDKDSESKAGVQGPSFCLGRSAGE